jgi:hypothetical protein
MYPRFLQALGVFLLAVPVVLVVAFGTGGLRSPAYAVQFASMALAGSLVLAGGLRASYTLGGRTVRWNICYGVGTAILGVGLAVGIAGSRPAGTGGVLLAVAAVGGGLSLVFIGYDVARGGRHFRVPDRSDPSERPGSE